VTRGPAGKHAASMDRGYHLEMDRPVWPPKNQAALLAVRNQAPVISYTSAFRLENMLHLTPSATTDRAATVRAGQPAPDFDLVRTDGERVNLGYFKGRPLVMRLTRAVAERVV
jgi:hypothetical protein